MFAYCLNNPVNSSDPTGELTHGQIHNIVLDHIVEKKRKEGRDTLTRMNTCIYYNCVDYTGGIGFCDLYDTETGEVWELKKDSKSYTCSTSYASNQLKGYIAGRLRSKAELPLSRGGALLVGKTTFSYNDPGGTYFITYWEEGNGILRYSYTYKKKVSDNSAAEIMSVFLIGIASPPSSGGGAAKVIAFGDDHLNAA